MHAAWFGRIRSCSVVFGRVRQYYGSKIHTLKPKLECVKSILQFMRFKNFYNFHNIGLIYFFHKCLILLLKPCRFVSRIVKMSPDLILLHLSVYSLFPVYSDVGVTT